MPTNYSVIFTKRQKAELISSPFSDTPKINEITGKTIVSIISSGSETGGFMGYGDGVGQYPTETGYANIMQVSETGSGVTTIQPGDYVFTQTPHRLYNTTTIDRVFPIPKDILPEKAILCRFPAVSMTALLKSSIKPTEPVLVLGMGIVGLMCAQVLRIWGYDVYAIDPCKSRLSTANHCGIIHTYTSIKEIPLSKKSAGLVIDCSGNDSAILSAIPYIRQEGELALVGVPWKQSDSASAHVLLREIFYSYLHVYSGFEWSLPFHSGNFDPNSNQKSMECALQWIANNSIVTDGIYKLFSPSDCTTLYPAIASQSLEKPCAIFDWRNF